MFYHSVELAPLISLGQAPWTFCLAGAELSEVFRGLGYGVYKELHLDTSKWLAWKIASVIFTEL